jgi:hypothetical protein
MLRHKDDETDTREKSCTGENQIILQTFQNYRLDALSRQIIRK